MSEKQRKKTRRPKPPKRVSQTPPSALFYCLEADKILAPQSTYPETYGSTFGRDGKPFFIAGPHDSPHFVRHVLNTLQRTAPGAFGYLLPAGDFFDVP